MLLWSARPRRCSSHQRAHGLGPQDARQRLAGRVAALDLLAERGAQPVVVGGREAVLGPARDLRGEQPLHRHAGAGACRGAGAPGARRDALDEAHQVDVEERHAQLEAGRHGHLVVADQDPVGQEHARVEVERLLEQVAAGDAAPGRPAAVWRRSASASSPRPPSSARRTGASVISTRRSSRSASPRPPSRCAARRARAARGSARATAAAGVASAAGSSRARLEQRRPPGGGRSRRAARRRPGPRARP